MAARRPPKKAAAKASAKAPGVAVPVSPRRLWQLIAGGFALLLVAAGGVWAVAAGIPRQGTMAVATAGSKAGFTVRQVDISGASNQPRLSIYRELLEGGSDSMFLLDLPAARERLKALPWVHEASIARRWPDRVEVRIVERKPAALWQNSGNMRLIDADGEVLPIDDLAPFSALPLLVGADARAEAQALVRLMASQPELAGQMKGAIWIGQRRWDLRMKTGETISLPEGPAAEKALAHFVRINGEQALLGRGFVRFDMRVPEKMVVRVATDGGGPVKPRKPKPAPSVSPPAAVPQSAPQIAAPPSTAAQAIAYLVPPATEVPA